MKINNIYDLEDFINLNDLEFDPDCRVYINAICNHEGYMIYVISTDNNNTDNQSFNYVLTSYHIDCKSLVEFENCDPHLNCPIWTFITGSKMELVRMLYIYRDSINNYFEFLKIHNET